MPEVPSFSFPLSIGQIILHERGLLLSPTWRWKGITINLILCVVFLFLNCNAKYSIRRQDEMDEKIDMDDEGIDEDETGVDEEGRRQMEMNGAKEEDFENAVYREKRLYTTLVGSHLALPSRGPHKWDCMSSSDIAKGHKCITVTTADTTIRKNTSRGSLARLAWCRCDVDSNDSYRDLYDIDKSTSSDSLTTLTRSSSSISSYTTHNLGIRQNSSCGSLTRLTRSLTDEDIDNSYRHGMRKNKSFGSLVTLDRTISNVSSDDSYPGAEEEVERFRFKPSYSSSSSLVCPPTSFPFSFSSFPFLPLSLTSSLAASLFPSLSLSFYLSYSFAVTLLSFFSLTSSLTHSFSVSLSPPLSISVSLTFSLSFSLPLFLSLSLSSTVPLSVTLSSPIVLLLSPSFTFSLGLSYYFSLFFSHSLSSSIPLRFRASVASYFTALLVRRKQQDMLSRDHVISLSLWPLSLLFCRFQRAKNRKYGGERGEGKRHEMTLLDQLPSPTPVALTFENISYTVPASKSSNSRMRKLQKTLEKATSYWRKEKGQQDQDLEKYNKEGEERIGASDALADRIEKGELPCENYIKNDRITILRSVSGYVRPRRMLALVGPSAARTTLLNVLAGRMKGDGLVTGSILYNGVPLTSFRGPILTAYVERDSSAIQSPFMTPLEVLRFSAALRLGQSCPSLSSELHPIVIEAVLSLFHLQHIKNRIIGRPGAGLSFEVIYSYVSLHVSYNHLFVSSILTLLRLIISFWCQASLFICIFSPRSLPSP